MADNWTSIKNMTDPNDSHVNGSRPSSISDVLIELAPLVITIDRVMTPIWYVIGFFGNPLVALIWLSKKTRQNNSSAVYVGTLAIVHILFLCLHFFMELNYTWKISTYNMPVLCEIFNVFYLFPQYFAPLLVLAFTVERYIAINHPFLKEKFCTVKRALYVSIGLGMFSFFVASLQGYIWSYEEQYDLCAFAATVPKQNFENVWTLSTELTFFLVVPLCVLVCNILVIKEIRRLTSEGPMAFQTHSAGSGIPTLTISLLSVSFFLICTLLPASIVYALQGLFPIVNPNLTYEQIAQDRDWKMYLNYLTVRKIVEEISMSNYVCYFFIYCITGPHFRREVARMLRINKCSKKLKHRRQSSSYQSERSEYTLITTKDKTNGLVETTKM